MSTETLFNPSPALQGQLLEAIASDQSSINQLAQTFSTTAEALSLFITTDSFAHRFAAIGSTNASLVRFSAGLNLHSAVRLLNTLALKLDEQLHTIPVDYTNPVSIEQFRRRAECSRQVASALYRLSRFTHEAPRAHASNSNFDTTSHQTRTPAPTSNESRASGTSERSDPAINSPFPVPNLHQARASESAERSDPGTNVPAPRDQQPTPTTLAAAHTPAPTAPPSPLSSPLSSATSRAASVTSAFPPSASLPAAPPAPHSSPLSSETSPAASATSAFLPSASLPAAPPSSHSSPLSSATSRAASVTSVFPPSSPAFPAPLPPAPAEPKEPPHPRPEIAQAA